MDREDRPNLFGEMRRLARTSSAVGGIAARVAGERMFGIKTNRIAHAEDLKAVLGGLKGPMMKAAQFLSTVGDALPMEYAAELAQLQANAPPMSWVFVRRRMEGELGPHWEQRFKQFNREAAAAASLGQVHRAELPDGRDVACKLQYPDMQSVVEADLRQMRIAMRVYAKLDNAIHHDDIYEELADRLREELDYAREAAQMRLYGIMLRDEDLVSVPAPVAELSTKRLLTMNWLQGRGLQSWLDEKPSQDDRNKLAEALFRAWYVPLYRFGVIHGDPHMGNYQRRADNGLNLLDFGSIRVFPPKFLRGVIDLYNAIRDKDDALAHHAYQSWGFGDLSADAMGVLSKWAGFLYEPLLQDRVRPIQENDDPTFGRRVASEVHAGLKRIGGIRPPREFVLMDRSAVGLGSVFVRLGAELNWFRLFHDLIDDFDETLLAQRQAAAMREAGLTAV